METNTATKPRRTASKEVRRRQLIDSTIKSIAKHGFSGTTMTTVTKAANLSLGIVNFHFKSKDNLFLETLIYLAEEHRNQWMQSIENARLVPEEQLLAIVDAHFHPNICTRQKLAVWFAFFGEAQYRAAYRDKLTEIDAERIGVTENLLLTILKDGPYEAIDARGVAMSLEGLYDGLWLNILLYPKVFSAAKAKRQIHIFLATTFPQLFKGTKG